MKENSSRSRIEVLSLTDAIKKQDILTKWAIPSEIVKSGSSNGKKGCVYALEFASAHMDNVKAALAEDGARGRKWIRD